MILHLIGVCLIVEDFIKFLSSFSKVSYHCGSFTHQKEFFKMAKPVSHTARYPKIFGKQLEDSCFLEPPALSLTVFLYTLSIVCSWKGSMSSLCLLLRINWDNAQPSYFQFSCSEILKEWENAFCLWNESIGHVKVWQITTTYWSTIWVYFISFMNVLLISGSFYYHWEIHMTSKILFTSNAT